MEVLPKPDWGTRPANRRELIIRAAAGLFATRGYENVTVTEIATAVSVGPSALYRHFPGKDEILVAVLQETLNGFSSVLSAEPGERLLPHLAEYALHHRQAGVLWQREARHLPTELRRPLRSEMIALYERLAAALPDTPHRRKPASVLHATGALSVILSPSFHHYEIPHQTFHPLLAEIAARVVGADVGHPTASTESIAQRGMERTSRREVVLTAAVRLFARQTYASTGLDEIAAAVGLSTSSVYNYFPSKQDILIKCLQRGNGYLQVGLEKVFARAGSAEEALHEVVAFYAEFALQHPDVVTILITEARSLPELDGADLLRSQRDFVGEWVSLLKQTKPELDPARAQVTARAAIVLLNDLARSGELRARSDAHATMCTFAWAALGF